VVWKQAVHAGMVGWRLGAQIAVMTVARVRRATVAELVTVSAVVMLIAMVAHAWRKRYASRTKEATRRAMRSLKANISGLYQKYMQRWWLRARATTRAFYSSWYARRRERHVPNVESQLRVQQEQRTLDGRVGCLRHKCTQSGANPLCQPFPLNPAAVPSFYVEHTGSPRRMTRPH